MMHFQRVPSLCTDTQGPAYKRWSAKVRATPWTAFLPPTSLGPQVEENPFTNNAQITQQLPRTSAVWAHEIAMWPPEERLLKSSKFKNYVFILAYGNPKSGSCYLWKSTAPLTTYRKPAALHSIHILWTPSGIWVFCREILCKESVVSKPPQ